MSLNRELFFSRMGLPSANPLALEIERARGIFLYDPTGKDYIDLVSGVAVSNVGHLHPHVLKAVRSQLDKYMHLMVYGEMIQAPQTRLADLLTAHLPANLSSVYFVNSGSEAIEGALKLAKRLTSRPKIISCYDAYHGGTHGALSILGSESLKYAFRPLLPEVYHIHFNQIDDLELITEETAAVVVECVQAEAGILLPQTGYLKALRSRCDQTGTMLVIDDIQMGMGRTGKLFSFEHFDIVPDILVLAKALGGGMPLGAFLTSKEKMQALTFNPELGHITTFGGHPVSCAAAHAALEVIMDEKLHEQADQKGKQFAEALSSHPRVKAIRQIGLMLGIDLDSANTADQLIGHFTREGLITDRFLFRPHAFRIAPPLNITPKEIDLALNRIIRSLDRLQ